MSEVKPRECITHHRACDCREREFEALLEKCAALDAEVERWINAFKIASDQAMANGRSANQLREQVRVLREGLAKIEEANRMGYGLNYTYGELAAKTLARADELGKNNHE